ncbi:MAG: tRNA uridine-5-carboxymethylaminomethyl(34) synthesis GTPase MnmE [bacterium]
MLSFSDNIVAEITPVGRAAISGIRISGKNAKEVVEKLFNSSITQERHSYLLKNDLDEAVVVYYKAPNSYTGEDVCEIFCHGNPTIVNSFIDRIISNRSFNIRIAEPGEYTKRAYLNDKMDLIQAEAVADIINSSNTTAASYRNQVLKGDLSKVIEKIKAELLDISVFTELEIDFEEESAGVLDKEKAKVTLTNVLDQVRQILSSFSKIESLSRDIKVLIIGEANVGKSSIFNRLIEQDRSIVHEHPGTTRDYIEADLFMNGLEVTLIDTAGFRDVPNCDIERMGIEKINELINSATLILEVTDKDGMTFKHYNSIKVRNKIDVNRPNKLEPSILYTSKNDPNSIKKLKSNIEYTIKKMFETVDDRTEHFLLTKRQRESLSALEKQVDRILSSIQSEQPIDAVSFMIKDALDMINKLTGREKANNEMLDELFSRFCIGK